MLRSSRIVTRSIQSNHEAWLQSAHANPAQSKGEASSISFLFFDDLFQAIPVILKNKDVVAMARTGSGKTAAFLIPMFEKLKGHDPNSGPRALILSPTRELALQTLKFTREVRDTPSPSSLPNACMPSSSSSGNYLISLQRRFSVVKSKSSPHVQVTFSSLSLHSRIEEQFSNLHAHPDM